MASGDANVFPPKNQAFRLPVTFRDNTGALITGWTGAASSIVVDGAAAVSGSAPTEVGATGMGYLDMTAGQMNGKLVQVKCTVTNTNALATVQAIFTGGLLEITSAVPSVGSVAASVWTYADPGDAAGRATTTGALLAQAYRYLFNRNSIASSIQTVYRDDSTTAMVSGDQTATDTSASRSKLQ